MLIKLQLTKFSLLFVTFLGQQEPATSLELFYYLRKDQQGQSCPEYRSLYLYLLPSMLNNRKYGHSLKIAYIMINSPHHIMSLELTPFAPRYRAEFISQSMDHPFQRQLNPCHDHVPKFYLTHEVIITLRRDSKKVLLFGFHQKTKFNYLSLFYLGNESKSFKVTRINKHHRRYEELSFS